MPQAGNSLIHHPTRRGGAGAGAGRCAAGGFTLVEMLVVIGIIVILIGLAMFAVHAARSKAEQARMAADLQTIGTALDAYRADFGDYPRIPEAPAGPVVYPVTPYKFPPIANMMDVMTYLPNAQYISGGELLCWALVGPYEMTPTADYISAMSAAAANPKFPIFGNPSSDIQPGDASAGSGFRLNRAPGADGVLGTPDDVCRGQVYASYLNVERFRIGRQRGYERYMSIMDSQGMPILYFPLTPKPAGQMWGTIVHRWDPALMAWAPDMPHPPAYDFRDNEVAFLRGTDMDPAVPLARMRVMLGDRNDNGIIDGGETAPATLPYLLWTAGPDTLYGPTDPSNASQVNNCDDVTNIKY